MAKKPDDKLKLFPLRLPEKYIEELKAKSAEMEITVADLIRSRIVDESVKPLVQPLRRKRPRLSSKYIMTDPALLREFARIGNNMNQVARWVNTNKSRAESLEVLYFLAAIEHRMNDALQKLPRKKPEEG